MFLKNLPLLVTLPHLLEVSIGHALVADALECGLENTVKAYIKALKNILNWMDCFGCNMGWLFEIFTTMKRH